MEKGNRRGRKCVEALYLRGSQLVPFAQGVVIFYFPANLKGRYD